MLDVTVMRQGKQVDLKLMPRGVKTQNGVVGQLGIRPRLIPIRSFLMNIV